MKKVLISVALGLATGMVLSQVPAVDEFLAKGKKKIKNLTK